jgi:DNA-binding response OmpR family regulator
MDDHGCHRRHGFHAVGHAVRVGAALALPVVMFLPRSSRKKRIHGARSIALVVEDDPHLQRAMSRQLERMSFQVLSASHYDAAVRHLHACEPLVACVDVGLPNKSGYELCEHIRGSLGLLALPILMTSEYGSPGDMAQAENAGGNAFLRKPFSMRELTDCVESLLSPSRSSAPTWHELQLFASRPTFAERGRPSDALNAQLIVRREPPTATPLL